MRLLVIDDPATVRAMVEQVVRQEPGWVVAAVAADVAGARRLLEEVRPDLITLDLNMPGIGGLALLEEMATRRHAAVVVLSSATLDGSDAARDALARGADACFDKARLVADVPRLRRLLRRTVDRHRRQLARVR